MQLTHSWKAVLFTFATALAAALLFLALTTRNLTAQGLYYDELHQATPAFAYTGHPPQAFAPLLFHGIPVMNMTYSGAMKTGLYGLFLRYSGQNFSVFNWRMTGLLIAAAGMFLFVLITRPIMPIPSLLLLLFLMLTDNSLLLMTRHDWGPVALAFSLRLFLIALLIRAFHRRPPSCLSLFLIPLMAGVSIFEKLNNIVLIGPVLLFFLLTVRTYRLRHWLAGIAGALLGALPLLCVNLLSRLQSGTLISLSGMTAERSYSLSAFWTFLQEYLTLGHGGSAGGLILGTTPAGPSGEWIIPALLGAALLFSIVFVRHSSWCKAALFFGAAYFITGVLLYFLPRPTSIYHWITGTPFQYTAIACGLAALPDVFPKSARQLRWIPCSLLLLVAVPRLPNAYRLQTALQEGRHSHLWHPDLNRLGEWARMQSSDTMFVAADWGVSTPIMCFWNGAHGKVLELFWGYGHPDQLTNLFNEQVSVLHVVTLNPRINVMPDNTARLFRDIDALTARGQLIPCSNTAPAFSTVSIQSYTVPPLNANAPHH